MGQSCSGTSPVRPERKRTAVSCTGSRRSRVDARVLHYLDEEGIATKGAKSPKKIFSVSNAFFAAKALWELSCQPPSNRQAAAIIDRGRTFLYKTRRRNRRRVWCIPLMDEVRRCRRSAYHFRAEALKTMSSENSGSVMVIAPPLRVTVTDPMTSAPFWVE